MADKRAARRIAASLAAAPRLPKLQQRRLDDLIEKGADGSLSPAESAELEVMLEHVDRQSFWMLAKAISRQPSAPPPKPSASRRQLARR